MVENEPRQIIVTAAGLNVNQLRLALGIGDPTLRRYIEPRLKDITIPEGRTTKIPGREIQVIKEVVDLLRKRRTLPRRRTSVEILFQLDG